MRLSMPLARGEGLGGEALVVDHARFLRDPVIAEADVQPALGHVERRIGELHPVGPAIDHRVASTVSFMVLSPTQTPAKRESAKP
jgi:hypothetical protein